jgi:heat shock protein HslJ
MFESRRVIATIAAMALTASLSASALAASEPDPEPMPVDLVEGITWLLTSQAVDGALAQLPDGAFVSLLMENGQAGGQGGCNSYFSSYELAGFELSFRDIGSTMMACLPPLMDVEQAYFANLAAVATYQSTGGSMALLDGDGEIILEFVPAPEATIVGSWVASGINDQQPEAGVVSSAVTSEVTAEFSPDGDLTGFDGCNRYFTTYTVDGESITVDEMIGTTRMACASDELAEQSQWYLGALVKAATWSVDAAGNLELRDADGSLQVSYIAAE